MLRTICDLVATLGKLLNMPPTSQHEALHRIFLQDKYGCPVVLLVVCSKKATARWARQPIEIGLPDLIVMIVHPVVLGPDNVQAVTDPAEASLDATFAVFSALTHSRSPELNAILEALADALLTIDAETAALLTEITEVGLDNTAGQQKWRELMATYLPPFVSEFRLEGIRQGRQEGREEGLAEGRAEAILRILDRRGIVVDDDARQTITSCADLDTLDTWLDRSLTATQVSELFA
jgi:hypothetical protein